MFLSTVLSKLWNICLTFCWLLIKLVKPAILIHSLPENERFKILNWTQAYNSVTQRLWYHYNETAYYVKDVAAKGIRL